MENTIATTIRIASELQRLATVVQLLWREISISENKGGENRMDRQLFQPAFAQRLQGKFIVRPVQQVAAMHLPLQSREDKR